MFFNFLRILRRGKKETENYRDPICQHGFMGYHRCSIQAPGLRKAAGLGGYCSVVTHFLSCYTKSAWVISWTVATPLPEVPNRLFQWNTWIYPFGLNDWHVQSLLTACDQLASISNLSLSHHFFFQLIELLTHDVSWFYSQAYMFIFVGLYMINIFELLIQPIFNFALSMKFILWEIMNFLILSVSFTCACVCGVFYILVQSFLLFGVLYCLVINFQSRH